MTAWLALCLLLGLAAGAVAQGAMPQDLSAEGAGPEALPRLRVSENHRFLVTEDGRPFFYLADTAWELFHRLSREEADRYLSDRAAKGFTVIRREMRQWIAEVLKSRPGTHAVRGRVLDASGKGTAGARVQCGTWHWTVTGADGGYVIPSLVPGRRRLSVTKNGFAFAPTERDVVVEDRDVDAEPFTGTPVR